MRRKLSREVRLLGAAIAWGCLFAPSATARPRRAGEVVRLERPSIRAAMSIRICPVILPNRSQFTCFGGAAPKSGSEFTLLDLRGYRGKARVLRSRSVKPDPCHLDEIHDVTFKHIDAPGTVGAIVGRRGGPMVAVRAPGIDPARSRVMRRGSVRSPGGKGQAVWLAIDRDGDREPDLVVTAYNCSRAHPPPPMRVPGKHVRSYCIDYWVRGSRWRRAGRDLYLVCD